MDNKKSFFGSLIDNFSLADLFIISGVSKSSNPDVKQIRINSEIVAIKEILSIDIGPVNIVAKAIDGSLLKIWTDGTDNTKVYCTSIQSNYSKTL